MRLLGLSMVIAAAAFGLLSTNAEIDSGQLEEKCGLFVNYKYFASGNKTEFNDYPWIALLLYDTPKGQAYGCGGVLLSRRYVLTAAHCVARLGKWNLTTVRLGEYDVDTDVDCYADGPNDTVCAPPSKNYAVESVLAHEEFGPGRAHDIALVRLNETIPEFTDFIQPICLPTVPSIKQQFHVSGWGRLAGHKGSATKLRSSLKPVNTSKCVEWYGAEGVKLADDQICAGNWTKESGGSAQEPCIADSGGPLMGIEKTAENRHRMTVFGLLTMDSRFCGVNGWPGVYVDVFRYKDWILKHVNKE